VVFVIAGGSLQQKNFAYTIILVDLLANIECKFLEGEEAKELSPLYMIFIKEVNKKLFKF